MSRLRCVECDRLWSAEAAKPGERCGVRLSGKHWCDGVLIEVKQLPAAVEQGLRDFSALRKEHDAAVASSRRMSDEREWLERENEAMEKDLNHYENLLDKLCVALGHDRFRPRDIDPPEAFGGLLETAKQRMSERDELKKDLAEARAEVERITHNMVQTERHAQLEEREVGRLNDLLNRILGDDGPDIDAYLDGHVEIPSVPGLYMQRDALVKELADLFGWSDRSYLHAAMHVKNAVLNMKADISTSHAEVDLLTKKLFAAYGLLEQISDELREETECDCPPEWPRCVACRLRLRIQAALPKEKP